MNIKPLKQRMTPLARTRMKALAKAEASTIDNGSLDATPEQASTYQMMLALFHKHYKALKKTKSIEKKIELKTDFLPEYEAYIDGILEADTGGENQVLVNILVWRIDTGDIPGALEIATYVLKHDLNAPDRFNRDPLDIIVEEAAEKTLGVDGVGDVSVLLDVLALADGRDVVDQAMMKLHKAIGLSYEEIDQEKALEHLTRAHELGLVCKTQAGVTKKISSIKSAIKKAELKATAKAEGNEPAEVEPKDIEAPPLNTE